MSSVGTAFLRPLPALFAIALLATLCGAPRAWAEETRLLRQPDVSRDHVTFAYANDIWIANRDGSEPRRLTTFPGNESWPHFSPDGRRIAFSGQYDGNTDVYVVSVEGGNPQRLTWHPRADTVRGFSPDGKTVLFASGRESVPVPYNKFFRVAATGGMPEPLPYPRVWDGQFNADATRFAYAPIQLVDLEWRGYRGGQARPIWVVETDDYELTKLPWTDSVDTSPVWLGETIYFLSDRDWAVNVWSYDTADGTLTQVTRFDEFDCKNLDSGAGALIFENGGWLWLHDPGAGTTEKLEIEIRADLPWTRPHWADVGDALTNPSLSPTGKRALFEARGEIFTVPVEKGDWRNLTRSPGVADRNPIWAPDGSRIAWFSDAEGEYALMIADQDGLGEPRRIELRDPSFYFTPAWSPDSRKILFTDEGLNLSWVDVESGRQTRIDTDQYAHPQRTVNPSWAPDSQHIAYSRRLDSQYHAIMVHSIADGTTRQLTDGLSDAVSPVWDAGGKYLWFLASTNFALSVGWLDMTSYERPTRRAIYFAVLSDETPSPLLPLSDEEEVASADDEDADGEEEEEDGDEKKKKKDDGDEESEPLDIDWEGIGQRILSIDAPERNYLGLLSAGDGAILYAEAIPNQPGATLHRYSLEDRESKLWAAGVEAATVSHDGKNVLYSTGGGWAVAGSAAPAPAGEGGLSTALRTKVDPRAEWRQIFREAWRYQRDFFYVDNIHGADWDWVFEAYSPWVEHVGHRSDLTHLLDILGGETSIGHSFTFGGDTPEIPRVTVGLLGADFEVERGRYRIARIYDGENWNPQLRSPLSAPGIDAKVGDYLVGVNGVELRSETNLYVPFEATADRRTVLHLNDKPTMEDAREVTVVPVADDLALRSRAWVEDNRRKVDEMSGGKLAYVWLPNTGQGGYTYFNRYYFAQQHKQGAVIDERFNGGGSAADYIVDLLDRELLGFFNNPVGENKPFKNPNAGIWGPKVMLVNESAGSGGDLLPWMFRARGIGPLIGTTTWGGLVGIWDVPPLVDGGLITAPRGGFYDNEGKWAVENEGVAPDIEVEMIPREVIAGGDPQLERAVEEALRLLREYDGQPVLPQPPDPVRSRRPR